MKVNKFVKPKDSEVKYQKHLLLLQNFNEFYLNLKLNDCGEHNIYHVNYQKFDGELSLLLNFVVPQFYGCVYEVDDENYLYICEVDENLSVLSDHKKLIVAVLGQINELNGTKSSFNKDYCRTKLGDSLEKMSVGAMLKISYAVVSFTLIREGKLGLLVQGHLMECFYENLFEEVTNDEFEIIESEK